MENTFISMFGSVNKDAVKEIVLVVLIKIEKA